MKKNLSEIFGWQAFKNTLNEWGSREYLNYVFMVFVGFWCAETVIWWLGMQAGLWPDWQTFLTLLKQKGIENAPLSERVKMFALSLLARFVFGYFYLFFLGLPLVARILKGAPLSFKGLRQSFTHTWRLFSAYIRFLFIMIFVLLTSSLVAVIARSAFFSGENEKALIILGILIAVPTLIYVASRFALFLPVIVTGEKRPLSAAWRFSKGHFWQIFLGVFFCLILVSIVTDLPGDAFTELTKMAPWVLWIEDAFSWLFYTLGSAFFYSYLGFLFREIQDAKKESAKIEEGEN
jgi:hypothetical protein